MSAGITDLPFGILPIGNSVKGLSHLLYTHVHTPFIRWREEAFLALVQRWTKRWALGCEKFLSGPLPDCCLAKQVHLLVHLCSLAIALPSDT